MKAANLKTAEEDAERGTETMAPGIRPNPAERLRRRPTGVWWVGVWAGSLAVPWLPPAGVGLLAALGWLMALLLAPGRFHGRKLLTSALLFLGFWAALLALIHLARPETPLRTIPNLAAWLVLGLNLMLAKTPLELALPLGQLLTPILGRRRAQQLALALALLARLIPRLLTSALAIQTTTQRRAGHLPLPRRLSLWGRAVLREAFNESEDLSRALLKRWPWAEPTPPPRDIITPATK